MSAKLAELYGASFSTYISRKGNQHWFDVNVNMVNGAYLHDDTLFEQAVDFIKEALFAPKIKNEAFDQDTFVREKDNLIRYIESTKDDKGYYASLKLNELFFGKESVQSVPSFSSVELLEPLDAKMLADYYQEMLANDLIHIIVLGDVEEEAVVKALSVLPFADRQVEESDVFYYSPKRPVIKELLERQAINQSKLAMAYELPYRYDAKEYGALQVFNGIFGAYPHSKLFQSVREKESMAYSIQSSFDSFRGILSVTAGINRKNRQRVMKLVHHALEEIAQGQITSSELEKTKELLNNSFLQSLDRPAALIEIEFMREMLPMCYRTPAAWKEAIDSVTIEDVKEVAKHLNLACLYFLEGTKEEA